jgi:tRNA-dihydrouridine synthase
VKSCPEITVEEKLMTALRQLELLASYKTEKIASREMRKHFAHYTRGFPHSTLLRRAVNSAETIAQYREIVQNFLSLELEEANN